MAWTWIEGDLLEVPIEWVLIEAICPVADDRELLRIKLTAASDEDEPVYFDDLQLFINLTREKLLGWEKVFLPLGQLTGNAEIPVFGAVVEAKIVAAHIVPKQTITGNNSSYCTLKLVNKETGAAICTKTFLAGVDAPAFEVTDFGPVNEVAGAINLGQGVSLVKEDSGGGLVVPESMLIIQWDLR